MAAENLPKGITDSHPRVVCRARFAGKDQEPKELHYLCLQGMGEIARLLLEASQTPYDSVMYFGLAEYKTFAPFGQVPVYKGPELDGLLLAQSVAICRHIARETGMDGSTVLERATQDMVWELGHEISDNKKVIYDEGPLDTKMERLFNAATKMIQTSGGPYFCGTKLGYGDMSVFHALHRIDELKPGFFKPWTELQTFVSAVCSIPSINAYLSSPRRVPLTDNELGNKGHKGAAGYVYTSPLNKLTVAEVYDK